MIQSEKRPMLWFDPGHDPGHGHLFSGRYKALIGADEQRGRGEGGDGASGEGGDDGTAQMDRDAAAHGIVDVSKQPAVLGPSRQAMSRKGPRCDNTTLL